MVYVSEQPGRGTTSAWAEHPQAGTVSSTTLLQIGTELVRRIRLIIACGVAAAAIASIYLALSPPRYIATAELLVDPRGLRLAQADPSGPVDSNETAIALVESQADVMRSTSVLGTVVERLHLDRDPEFIRPSVLGGVLPAALSPGSAGDGRIAALRTLQRSVSVQRASRSYTVVLSASSQEPGKAARIVEALTSAYLEEAGKARTEQLTDLVRSVASGVPALENRLRTSETSAEEFKRERHLVGAGGQLVDERQLVQLSGELAVARAQAVELQARVKQVEAVGTEGDASAVGAVQSPALSMLRAQSAALTRREGEVAASLGERHPASRAAAAQRKQNEGLVNEELRRIAQSTRNAYLGARANEQALALRVDDLLRANARSSETMVRMRELQRVAGADQAALAAALTRAKTLEEQANLALASTRVITPAAVPDRSSTPRLSLVIVALLAGLVVGAAAVVFRAMDCVRPSGTGSPRP